MKKQCLVVFVENNAGVLARVASLFVQRGFNIDSLTVSPTENEAISRITIMTRGDEKFFSQIMKQTGKLIETKMIFSVEPTFSLIREILLIKFSAEAAENAQNDGGFCEYVVLRLEKDEDGEDTLVSVDDDDEFDNVADVFDDMFSEEIDYDGN